MYNLFTTDNLDGVMTAAHHHALARHTKSGIHVCFCRDDLSRRVKALSDTIALAHTLGHKLPDVRFIVLAGIHAPLEVDAVLDRLEQEDSTVRVFREPYLETSAVWRVLLHAFIRVFGMLLGREEVIYMLSDFFYNKHYGKFDASNW